MRYEFDYSRLKGRIKEKYNSQSNFVKDLKMSEQVFSKRINNQVQFDSSEIKKMAELLEISDDEISEYFFKEKVEKTQH